MRLGWEERAGPLCGLRECAHASPFPRFSFTTIVDDKRILKRDKRKGVRVDDPLFVYINHVRFDFGIVTKKGMLLQMFLFALFHRCSRRISSFLSLDLLFSLFSLLSLLSPYPHLRPLPP